MDTGLGNKVVLVTGASGGIGAEVAKRFSEEGAQVVLHAFQNVESAKRVAAGLAGKSLVLGADLRDESQVARLFADIEKALGPVDILVANSGIWHPVDVPLYEMSLEQWNRTLDTNLTSMFLCLREFFRGIRKHHLEAPSAVLVGSTAGIFGEAGHCDYAASKSAATGGLLLSLKNELARIARHGRINAVCPSWVMTPMAGDFLKEKASVTKALQTVALRKLARPSDVASAILFLASPALSGHVSGQSLTIAGGMEGRLLYHPDEIDLKLM